MGPTTQVILTICETRISAHHAGRVEGYTASKLPVEVVFVQPCATRYEALATERKIKNWSKKKKEALIENNWQKLSLLAKKDFKKKT